MPASATAASPALPTATPRAAQQADNSRNGAPGQGCPCGRSAAHWRAAGIHESQTCSGLPSARCTGGCCGSGDPAEGRPHTADMPRLAAAAPLLVPIGWRSPDRAGPPPTVRLCFACLIPALLAAVPHRARCGGCGACAGVRCARACWQSVAQLLLAVPTGPWHASTGGRRACMCLPQNFFLGVQIMSQK